MPSGFQVKPCRAKMLQLVWPAARYVVKGWPIGKRRPVDPWWTTLGEAFSSICWAEMLKKRRFYSTNIQCLMNNNYWILLNIIIEHALTPGISGFGRMHFQRHYIPASRLGPRARTEGAVLLRNGDEKFSISPSSILTFLCWCCQCFVTLKNLTVQLVVGISQFACLYKFYSTYLYSTYGTFEFEGMQHEIKHFRKKSWNILELIRPAES